MTPHAFYLLVTMEMNVQSSVKSVFIPRYYAIYLTRHYSTEVGEVRTVYSESLGTLIETILPYNMEIVMVSSIII